MTAETDEALRRRRLIRVISIAIAVSLLTIGMKTVAWLLTGSVGLLSDALESVVNLVAALVGLVVILWSTRPPDEDHAYGHEKADYVSAGFEGALILLAAFTIAYAAIERLIHPAGLSEVGIGLTISVVASLINLGAAGLLIRSGREEQSLTLVADGRHLMTDVWTTAGVVVGIGLVWLTGWQTLDPLIALAVAGNIVRTGVSLVRGSMSGLMDKALPPAEIEAVGAVLARYEDEGSVEFHALRTRKAGRRSFITVHVLVPGEWSVQAGHDFVERVEGDLRRTAEPATVFTHLEPVEDPVSFEDTQLDRKRAQGSSGE